MFLNKMGIKKGSIYEFGRFHLDPHRRLLFEEGSKRLPLPPKALDLLILLIENRDRVMSREKLLQTLWPNAIVEESNLTQNLFLLRKALGEDAHEHRYIVTIHGSGYRFVSDVRSVADASARLNQNRAFSPTVPKKEIDRALRAIAVLPFRALSTDPHEQCLGYGIAEALCAKLSGYPQLVVRTSSAIVLKESRAEHKPLRIGRRLGVESIVCGTVMRQGERVRITIENVLVRDGTLDWAAQFEGTLKEIFTLQDEVATNVANALTTGLDNAVQPHSTWPHTESTDAYLLYLRGQYVLSRRSPQGLLKAAECFEQASQLDPVYAPAFAGSADSHCLLAYYNVVSPLAAWPKAMSAAVRALKIDDRLAEVHATLGLVCLGYERDWRRSERECLRALALKPDFAIAHDYYAEYLSAAGRHFEALAAIKRALELDPLSLIINCDLGANLYRARQYTVATKQLENTVLMDSSFALAHWWLGCTYEVQGLYQRALSEFEEAFKLCDNSPVMLASIGHSYALCRDTERAHNVIDQLVRISRHRYVSPFDLALPYIGLGEKDEAFSWLEKAYADRPWQMVYLSVDPRLDPIRSDPRYDSLLHRLRLRDET